jgi:hypothetical protein
VSCEDIQEKNEKIPYVKPELIRLVCSNVTYGGGNLGPESQNGSSQPS